MQMLEAFAEPGRRPFAQDLILFPGDATLSAVPGASRVLVLRFTSSSARHFYWLQDPNSTRDKWQTDRVNALIDDPDAPEQPFQENAGGDAEMSDSSTAATGERAGSNNNNNNVS